MIRLKGSGAPEYKQWARKTREGGFVVPSPAPRVPSMHPVFSGGLVYIQYIHMATDRPARSYAQT